MRQQSPHPALKPGLQGNEVAAKDPGRGTALSLSHTRQCHSPHHCTEAHPPSPLVEELTLPIFHTLSLFHTQMMQTSSKDENSM